MNQRQRIALFGYGYVGRAMADMLIRRYDVMVYDPLIGSESQKPFIQFVRNATDMRDCILSVIATPTPMNADGSCDTSLVEQSVRNAPTSLILIKSTISPGTTDRLRVATGKHIVFSPEYIGESSYFNPHFSGNMLETPFLICGGEKQHTRMIIDLLLPILGPTKKYFQTTALNAEIIKYMENVYFAAKVTFMNEMFEICETLGADWHEVREGWLLDPRVEPMHTAVFSEKRGFGGKCYPKDLSAFIVAAQRAGYNPELLQQVKRSNEYFTLKNAPKKHVKTFLPTELPISE